jgi:large exoprotein involved in heme utilization and adhesion
VDGIYDSRAFRKRVAALCSLLVPFPQGRIELGSVDDNSFVSLTPIDAGFALGYEGVRNFQDINLSQRLSDRQVGGLFTGTADRGRAGNIAIDTIDLVLRDGAAIAADSLGEGAGGNLQITAANSVNIIGSGLSTVSIVPGVPFLEIFFSIDLRLVRQEI